MPVEAGKVKIMLGLNGKIPGIQEEQSPIAGTVAFQYLF